MIKFTAAQIAALVGGTIEGNPDAEVTKLSKIEEGVPGSISFLSNPLYTPYIYTTGASVVIVNSSFTPDQTVNPTLIRVEQSDIAFAKLLEKYNQIKNDKRGISEICSIDPSAQLGENCFVGAYAVIGAHVKIGRNVKIYPHVVIDDNNTIGDNTVLFYGVKIYSDNHIGNDCIIHAGVVIGGDGFRFNQQDGVNIKVPQIGNVIIEDNVEIGSNSAIDRATFGSTIIRKGAKFDNLVHIAHNVEVGENTCIAAATGIAGSSKVGRNCMISGHVAVTGHVSIADGTILGGATGVSKSLTKPGQAYLGVPALEVSKFRRSIAIFRNLPELSERITRLEKAGKRAADQGNV